MIKGGARLRLMAVTVAAMTLSACGGGNPDGGGTVTVASAPTQAQSTSACTMGVDTNAPFACKLSTSLSGPVTWSFTSGAQPGMMIQPKTGQIRWTPTLAQTGSYTVQASVTNGTSSQNRTFTVTVNQQASGGDPTGIYVATNGSDTSGTGSVAAPYKTLKKAVGLVNPGQTIFVRGGEYKNSEFGQSWASRTESSLVRITRAGTAGAPITLRPFGNEYVKLTSDVTGIAMQGASYWTIQGFEIAGSAQSIDYATAMSLWWTDGDAARRITGGGIANNGGDHVILRDNIIHDFPGGGINNRSLEFVNVENNIVYNNAWWTISGTNGVSSVSMATTDPANESLETVIYAGNLVFANQQLIISHVFSKGTVKLEVDEGAGMFLQNEGVTDVSPGTFRNRVRVENNIVAYNGKGGVGLNGIGKLVGQVGFYRNAFYRNARVAGDAGEITKRDSILRAVENNLFQPRPTANTIRSYSNEYANIFANATTGASGDGSKYPSILVRNPVFVDPANGDFAPGSAAPTGMGVIASVRGAISAKLAEYGIVITEPTQVVDANYIAAMKAQIFADWPLSMKYTPDKPQTPENLLRLDDDATGYSYTYAQRCSYPGVPAIVSPCA